MRLAFSSSISGNDDLAVAVCALRLIEGGSMQSRVIVQFLLHGRPEAAQVRVVQRHDFLTGVITFEPIPQASAWLSSNEVHARQLQVRSTS